jgi:hypothetical protein
MPTRGEHSVEDIRGNNIAREQPHEDRVRYLWVVGQERMRVFGVGDYECLK